MPCPYGCGGRIQDGEELRGFASDLADMGRSVLRPYMIANLAKEPRPLRLNRV